MRAARDAGDLPIPTVSSRKKVERREFLLTTGFGSSPNVPHTVFLGLLCAFPGGQTFYPPLLMLNAGNADPVESRPCITGIRDGEPLRRDRTAWAAMIGLRNPPMATAPDPHSRTPLETPLVDRDRRRINPPYEPGISFPAVFYKIMQNQWLVMGSRLRV